MDERERDEHAPLAEAVDEPALDRRADPRTPAASPPATTPATANEPVCSRR